MCSAGDQRTADLGSYADFWAFMVVMHGHIKIAWVETCAVQEQAHRVVACESSGPQAIGVGR
jgi:hypothetical protein